MIRVVFMSQQNPFSSQDPPFKETLTRSTRMFHAMIQASGLASGILGFGIIQTAGLRSQLEWTSDQGSHEPLADQLAQQVVLFPRTNRVTTTRDGVFIPRSLFGENEEVRHRQERRADGSPQIVVFSISADRELGIRKLPVPVDCSAEMRWLEEHRSEYSGLWVALDGERIVSSGREGHEVYKAARDLGITRPFLMYVEPTEELPFAGW